MASLIDSLVNNLEKQLECYDEILFIQQNKTKAIVDNDLEEVQKVTRNENELAGRISRLEREREKVMGDIALVLNKTKKELTIIRLTELLNSSSKESMKLLELRESILNVVNILKETNEQNSKLVDHALNYIQFTINAVQTSRAIPDSSVYAAKGKAVNQSQNRYYFDAKQ